VPSEVKDKVETTNLFTGGPSKWDPYSKGIAISRTMATPQDRHGSELSADMTVVATSLQKTSQRAEHIRAALDSGELTTVESIKQESISSGLVSSSATEIPYDKQIKKASVIEPQSLQDAIKEKARRKKKKKGHVKQET